MAWKTTLLQGCVVKGLHVLSAISSLIFVFFNKNKIKSIFFLYINWMIMENSLVYFGSPCIRTVWMSNNVEICWKMLISFVVERMCSSIFSCLFLKFIFPFLYVFSFMLIEWLLEMFYSIHCEANVGAITT